MATAISHTDTICALATSARPGGVGIVRVSGPLARTVLERIAPRVPRPPKSHRLYYADFQDPQAHLIDSGYAVLMAAPRSYTREDVVELHGHGGHANLERLLAAVMSAGARPAQRGEFTLRAFLSGRLDLSQAEAVMDVVSAPTETALDIAHRQLRGGLSERVRTIRDSLLTLHAALEVQIDFVEEDLGAAHKAVHTAALSAHRAEVQRLADTWHRGRVLRGGARVVLLGPPNVGKSSLFNALLREARAIVTAQPGTTRDYLEETCDMAGVPITLVDTAGIRDHTSDPIERAGVERAHALATQADLVLLLRESSRPAPHALPPQRVLEVQTKRDLNPSADISAQTGEGLEALVQTIRDRVLPMTTETADRAVVTQARHHEALIQAAEALAQAQKSSAASASPELIAIDVDEATHQLGLIVGETTTDDLLDRIFSQFCIGK